MTKRRFVHIILISLLPILTLWTTGCGGGEALPAPDPFFQTDASQSRIDAASGRGNIWSGFRLEKEYLVSEKTSCKLIIWRTTAADALLTLAYQLKGKSMAVMVNGTRDFIMPPRIKVEEVSEKVSLLKGFNLIEFRLDGKSQLKLKSLSVADESKEPAGIESKGASVLRGYHNPGKGTMRIRAKGPLTIRRVQFENGRAVQEVMEKKSGLFSQSIPHDFVFTEPGFLEIQAAKPGLEIVGYRYEEHKEGDPLFAPPQAIAAARKNKPHVFIFLIDGCHFAHTSLAGYHRDTTPNMRALAEDGVLFANAYCNATFTRSSVASIFTGYVPHRHKLRILTNRLPKGLYMLPEFLKKNGYITALLTEAGNISEFFGFSQGVDNYQKVFRHWNDPRYLEDNIFRFYTEWLDRGAAEGTPLFTYVHLRAPHFPIIPPPPYLDKFKQSKVGPEGDRLILHLFDKENADRVYTKEEIQDITDDYDSSILYADAEVGRMVSQLKERGLYDSSFIVYTSDHGEALQEHKLLGHGNNVYNETSQIPLVVKFPKGTVKQGARVERVVQLVDIFPTLAALYEEKRFFDGRSLYESLKSPQIDDVTAFSTSFGKPPAVSQRWRKWHYVYHMYRNGEELFNLETDALKDLSQEKEHEDLVTFFRLRFFKWLFQYDNLERSSQSVDLRQLPKEEYENLKSLGYID